MVFEPLTLPRPDSASTYIELADEPPAGGLLPALTDEAFALHRAPLDRGLEAADASGR